MRSRSKRRLSRRTILPPVAYVQENQPDGVPPLALTGERTLPDVPEENYWYRRHLAVYEWIAARTRGLRVADLACGEGYGSADAARTAAAQVVGVDANPEAHEHARLRYAAPNLRFERGLVEDYSEPCDAVVFLQTIEHIHDPGALLARIAEAAPLAYVSTPNRLTLAPEGAEKSENPWHLREYTAAEYRELLEPHFSEVRAHRRLPCAEAPGPRGRARPGLGPRSQGDPAHEAFLRPVHPGDRGVGLRARDESECDLDKALDFLAVLKT